MDLSAVPQKWLVVALAFACSLVLLQAAWFSLSRALRRRRMLARIERGAEGEREAAEYMQNAGFTVLGAQVASSYVLLVNDEPQPVELRADLIVEKRSRRFVVEVKTGRVAPRLDTASTRRQLLEYQLAFDVDGVLLFDADSATLRSVEFPEPRKRRAKSTGLVLVAALAVAVLAYVLSHHSEGGGGVSSSSGEPPGTAR